MFIKDQSGKGLETGRRKRYSGVNLYFPFHLYSPSIFTPRFNLLSIPAPRSLENRDIPHKDKEE